MAAANSASMVVMARISSRVVGRGMVDIVEEYGFTEKC